MNQEWNGLIKLLEIWKTDANQNVIWRAENLYNMFHILGERFLLNAAFVGGVTNTYIPENYYFGLDNRSSLTADDTMTTITESGNEPTSHGYSRVAISSTSVFTVTLQSSHYRANGPIVSFSASSGSWGPVQNLFLTTAANNSGVLIASVALSQSLTLSAGETVNMRMGLSLRDCP